MQTDAGEVLLRTAERRDDGHEFADIVVLSRPDGSQVRVGAIGRVKDGFRENHQKATFDGKPAVMINVFRVGDQTPLEVAAAVKEQVAGPSQRRRAMFRIQQVTVALVVVLVVFHGLQPRAHATGTHGDAIGTSISRWISPIQIISSSACASSSFAKAYSSAAGRACELRSKRPMLRPWTQRPPPSRLPR